MKPSLDARSPKRFSKQCRCEQSDLLVTTLVHQVSYVYHALDRAKDECGIEALSLHIPSSLRGLPVQERTFMLSNLRRITSDFRSPTLPAGERIVLCNVAHSQGVTFDVQSLQE